MNPFCTTKVRGVVPRNAGLVVSKECLYESDQTPSLVETPVCIVLVKYVQLAPMRTSTDLFIFICKEHPPSRQPPTPAPTYRR